MKERYCNNCNNNKPILEFSKGHYNCKSCRNKLSKEKRGFIPISELKERVCNVCNILKPIEEFRIVNHKPRNYPDTKCLKCYNLSRIAYNKDKYSNNREEILEKNKKFQKEKRYSYNRWVNLKDSSVRGHLKKQGIIPSQELIEAKKQQILLIRQIKQHENGNRFQKFQ